MGSHLQIVSAGMIGIKSIDSTTSADSARLLRFRYDTVTKCYTLDAGFPVTITNIGTETITLAKDTVGTLWVTYTLQDQVYVAHSQGKGNDATWSTPYVLPIAGATSLAPDDISAVVAFTSQFGSYSGIILMVLQHGGSTLVGNWTSHVFGTVAENQAVTQGTARASRPGYCWT